jgi:ABC-2 type transport system permease protein
MLLVYLTAVLVHDVRLPLNEWIGVIVLMWIGVWPFALLGTALGYITSDTTAFGVIYGLYMAMSAAGGLWIPPVVLPATMLSVAKTLPTYHAADLGWQIANGQFPLWTSVIVLGSWTLLFLLAATIFARRAVRVR